MNTKITVTIDGQKVEGEITHRSAGDINVIITKPCQNVSRGLHIPYFASLIKRFDSDLGDKIAKDLLESIYHLCAFIFENMGPLTEQYLKLKKRIKFLEAKGVSEFVFKSKRLQLRKLLRSGKIDNIEYQKRLAPIRKEFEKFELKKGLARSRFFEEYFPMIIPAGTRKDIIKIIEDNIRATNKAVEQRDFKIMHHKMMMRKRMLLGSAFFIHPCEGQVIYVPHSHIALVLSNPEKFNLNFDYIKTIYGKYGEKIGSEGRASREILFHLIVQGFIVIRKSKNHWKLNIKDLCRDDAAIFLHRWAKSIIDATDDFHFEVIIEQRNCEVIETDLITLASFKFAGRPKNRIQARKYMPGPFLMISEVNPGPVQL
jgi:hypothetical protein